MRQLLLSMAAVVLLAPGLAQAQKNFCGDLKNAFGPYDYRRRADFSNQFYLVESAHFTEEVERGQHGSTGAIGADLDYTLRAIPNHARALTTMANLGLKNKTLKVSGAKYPVECYFDRAMRFQPDDGAVRAVYGSYLFSMGQDKQALIYLSNAAELSPNDATINYNAGLAYFKAKDYSKANFHANRAYQLGFPLPGLKSKLVSVGKWADLPDALPKPVPKTAADSTIDATPDGTSGVKGSTAPTLPPAAKTE